MNQEVKSATTEQISKRARELWEQAGRPDGRDLDYWLEAEREFQANKPQQSFPQQSAGATQQSEAVTPGKSQRTGGGRAKSSSRQGTS